MRLLKIDKLMATRALLIDKYCNSWFPSFGKMHTMFIISKVYAVLVRAQNNITSTSYNNDYNCNCFKFMPVRYEMHTIHESDVLMRIFQVQLMIFHRYLLPHNN